MSYTACLLLAQVHTSHERDEAIWVREQILTLRDQHNVKYQDIAVLYRTNLQVRVEEGIYVRFLQCPPESWVSSIWGASVEGGWGLYIFAGWGISASLGIPLGGEDSTR